MNLDTANQVEYDLYLSKLSGKSPLTSENQSEC